MLNQFYLSEEKPYLHKQIKQMNKKTLFSGLFIAMLVMAFAFTPQTKTIAAQTSTVKINSDKIRFFIFDRN